MNKRILSVSVAILATCFAFAQNNFEGTFTVHSESSKKEKAALDENFSVKNERVLVEMGTSQPGAKKTRIIINQADKSTTMLMDDGDRKMALRSRQQNSPGMPPPPQQPGAQPQQPGAQPQQPGAQPQQPGDQPQQPGQQPVQPQQPQQPQQLGRNDGPKPAITETKETKVIDGHSCKKVIIKGPNYSAEAWVTNDIKVNFADIVTSLNATQRMPHPTMGGGAPNEMAGQPKFPEGIQGFPLLIVSTNNRTGEVTTTTFKDVKKGPVDQAKFDMAGYQVMEMPPMPPPPPGAPDEDR